MLESHLSIRSDGGSFYESGLDKVDVLKVVEGKVIKLDFPKFDVEYGGSWCPYDHLSILDKDGSMLLNKTCGVKKETFTVCSRTNEVYLTFFTDCTLQRSGWTAEWSEEDECATYLPQSFYDPPDFSDAYYDSYEYGEYDYYG